MESERGELCAVIQRDLRAMENLWSSLSSTPTDGEVCFNRRTNCCWLQRIRDSNWTFIRHINCGNFNLKTFCSQENN